MKKLSVLAFALFLTGCMARDESYCNGLGLAKTNPEYSHCKAYFARMDSWFNADLNTCQGKAALAYPDYMYDHARYGETQTVDRFGTIRTANVLIEPDYARNMSLDTERMKIVTPCMNRQGWKSARNWQDGRMGEAPAPHF